MLNNLSKAKNTLLTLIFNDTVPPCNTIFCIQIYMNQSVLLINRYLRIRILALGVSSKLAHGITLPDLAMISKLLGLKTPLISK